MTTGLTPDAVAKHAEAWPCGLGAGRWRVWLQEGPALVCCDADIDRVWVTYRGDRYELSRFEGEHWPEDGSWTPVLPNGSDLPNESTTSILDAYTSGRRDGAGELLTEMARPRPMEEWREDYGPVLWWTLPVESPPWCGTPCDSDWPGYHAHWTPLGPTPGQHEIWGVVFGVTECREEPGSSAAARAAAVHALAVGEAYDRGRDDECSRWAEAIRDAGAACEGYLDDGTTVEDMLDDLVDELVRAHRPAPEPSAEYGRGRADERAAIVEGLEWLAQTYRDRGIEMVCKRLNAGEWSAKP